MAQIKSFDYYTTRWLLAHDVDGIFEFISDAAALPNTLRVVFVGEQHTSPYDVARRRRIADKMLKALDSLQTMVVYERFPEVVHDEGERVVVERGDFKSKDDARNSVIANRACAEYERLVESGQKVRSMAIFCGSEHEARVRQIMADVFPAKLGIHWLKVSPIMDVVEREVANYGATFDTTKVIPAGYTAVDPNTDHRLMLLTKGKVREPFNLEIVGPDLAPQLAQDGNVMGLFFKDPRLNLKCRTWIAREGSVHVRDYIRIAGDQCVVAVPMTLLEMRQRETAAGL